MVRSTGRIARTTPHAGRNYLALAGLAALTGCTAGAGSPTGRFVAVHNAFEAIGLGQVGHISEGSLAEGSSARFPMDLDAQCYTFVAFGGDGAHDVDVVVSDEHGQTLANDRSHDAQATTQVCPTARGRYTVAVRMTSGSGTFLLGSWRGTGRGTSAGGTNVANEGEGGAGSCSSPIPIQIGQTVTGDTSRGRSNATGSCFGNSEASAPELVYQLQVERRMQVTVAAEQDYDGALYIRTSCEDAESEVPGACNDDGPDTSHSRITIALDPGTYYIFADGFGDAHGQFTLSVTGVDVPSAQDVCQQAPALTAGQAMAGQTTNDPNVFQATCAQNARGPDHVYRLDVPQESRAQIFQESDYDGVLYVRRACNDIHSEVACNDDADDQLHSRINTVLPAGTYYVFTDGYTPTAAGNFTLEADLAPIAGGSVAGDTCPDAQRLALNTAVEGNTFLARDDVATPCGAAQDGYDVVYRLDVTNRSRVRVWFEGADVANNGVLYLARACTAAGTTAPAVSANGPSIACRAGAIGEDNAIDATLERGQYYVVVDSSTPRAFGRFRLQARVEDLTALDRMCRAAPMLRNHQTVTGTTQGDDHFQSSCAGGSHSAENLYRLHLTRRSHVRLTLQSTTENYDPSLYLRANCTDAHTERACNDDSGDTHHSAIDTTLDAGNYTVFVDGFSNRNNGGYSLQVDVTPE